MHNCFLSALPRYSLQNSRALRQRLYYHYMTLATSCAPSFSHQIVEGLSVNDPPPKKKKKQTKKKNVTTRAETLLGFQVNYLSRNQLEPFYAHHFQVDARCQEAKCPFCDESEHLKQTCNLTA